MPGTQRLRESRSENSHVSKFVLSCDDGCASDVRVADLCRKYGVEAIFYWPIEWQSLAYDKDYHPLTYQEALDIAKDFEIGGHTITHRHLTKMDSADASREIRDCKVMLERLFPGKKVTKFCPVRGYTNEALTRQTLTFYESQRLTRGEGLLHIHPNSGANNNMPWREYAKTIDVKEAWCHSWELNKFNLWDELEEYIRENYAS